MSGASKTFMLLSSLLVSLALGAQFTAVRFDPAPKSSASMGAMLLISSA